MVWMSALQLRRVLVTMAFLRGRSTIVSGRVMPANAVHCDSTNAACIAGDQNTITDDIAGLGQKMAKAVWYKLKLSQLSVVNIPVALFICIVITAENMADRTHELSISSATQYGQPCSVAPLYNMTIVWIDRLDLDSSFGLDQSALHSTVSERAVHAVSYGIIATGDSELFHDKDRFFLSKESTQGMRSRTLMSVSPTKFSAIKLRNDDPYLKPLTNRDEALDCDEESVRWHGKVSDLNVFQPDTGWFKHVRA